MYTFTIVLPYDPLVNKESENGIALASPLPIDMSNLIIFWSCLMYIVNGRCTHSIHSEYSKKEEKHDVKSE